MSCKAIAIIMYVSEQDMFLSLHLLQSITDNSLNLAIEKIQAAKIM